jgi:hypothetical protein
MGGQHRTIARVSEQEAFPNESHGEREEGGRKKEGTEEATATACAYEVGCCSILLTGTAPVGWPALALASSAERERARKRDRQRRGLTRSFFLHSGCTAASVCMTSSSGRRPQKQAPVVGLDTRRRLLQQEPELGGVRE